MASTALTRIAARTASALALLTLVAGVPWLLTTIVGWPLPDHVPTLDELGAMLTSPPGEHVYADAAAIAGWTVWTLFTAHVIAELLAWRGNGASNAHTGGGPLRVLAALLVTGILAWPTPALTAPAVASPPAAAVLAVDTPSPLTEGARLIAHADLRPTEPAPTTIATSGQHARIRFVVKGQRYHAIVAKGDTLSKIAKRWLGDADRWPELCRLNLHRHWPNVGGTLHDCDVIYPNWDLRLPDDAKPPSGAEPLTPAPATVPVTPSENLPTPKPATPSPHASSSPGTVFTPPPTTSTAAPMPSPSGVVTTPSRSPSPPAPASTSLAQAVSPPPSSVVVSPPAADGEQTQNVANDGVDLPGGWIGVGFGAALIAAATLVWKRRRHRYIPTPITSPTLDGPDLTAPLAALTRIRQTLRRNAPEALTEPDLGPTVHEWVRATIKPALPPVGPTGTDLAGVGELPMSAGLGLHGPAALDATRALLVAALTCGRPTDPDAKGEVVIPAATLATLLGVSAVDIGTIARLTVTPTFADAMTRIEEEIIRRTRVLAEAEAADITALRAGDSYAESLPQLLLIADVPDAGWHARLSTAIHLGRSAEIGAALLGQWPGGTTLTVAADGTTSGGVGERVAVLDTTAAAEMLAMLREAHDTAEIRTPAATSSRPSRERRVQADPASAPAVVDEPDDAVTCDAPARVERPVIASSASDPLPFTSAVAPVKVRVLGPPTILDVNGNPMRGMRAKSMELLVYLAVRKDGASLGDIMEAIWPDATMRRASERLSTCVANLRGVIRAAAQPDTSIAAMQAGDARKRLEPVVNTGGHYHLDAAIIDIDWWTVLDEYARVAVATDNGARLAHLHLAVAAMHGPLAAGCEYEWIDTDREYTRRHQIKIYAQAAALLTDTDSHQAKTLYDAACDLDPLSEELARHAMRAAAHVGDAEAISHRLATLRQQLCDIDTEVSTETEKLASSLRKDLARHDPDER